MVTPLCHVDNYSASKIITDDEEKFSRLQLQENASNSGIVCTLIVL